MTPRQWRMKVGLTLTETANAVGVRGNNPARTWQRWEAGERRPPTEIIKTIGKLSEGRVREEDWPEIADKRLRSTVGSEIASTSSIVPPVA